MSKTWGIFFLVAQDMVLSHRAKFQLIINFFRVSVYFVVFLPDYFGWLCLFPSIVVVYATTNQVNEFQDGLVGNRCNRSLGLTLKLTVFDVTPSVISSWDRIAACQYLFFFLYVNIFLSKCCSVNNNA